MRATPQVPRLRLGTTPAAGFILFGAPQRRGWLLVTLAVAVALALAGAAEAGAAEGFPGELVERRTLRERIAVEGGVARVVVDNVHGAIAVRGTAGDAVEMVAHETVRARSTESLARAREEVRLLVEREGREVVLFVDGPFRDCCEGRRPWRDPGYRVTYDLELAVPAGAAIELKTVDTGAITVAGMRGDFDVSNVNGPLRLEGLAGGGRAATVNGGVEASFAQGPRGACGFETVNGDIQVSFPSDLSAELWFSTFNGEAFTEFAVEPLPMPAAVREERDGRLVLSSGRRFGVRVARGGPELTFETLNGDITIRKRDERSRR